MKGRPWVAQATVNAAKHHRTNARAQRVQNMSPDCNSVNLVAEQSDDHRRRGGMQIFVQTLTERASTVSVCADVIEISVDAERSSLDCASNGDKMCLRTRRELSMWKGSWLNVRVGESSDRLVVD